jgi:hypothetical protein
MTTSLARPEKGCIQAGCCHRLESCHTNSCRARPVPGEEMARYDGFSGHAAGLMSWKQVRQGSGSIVGVAGVDTRLRLEEASRFLRDEVTVLEQPARECSMSPCWKAPACNLIVDRLLRPSVGSCSWKTARLQRTVDPWPEGKSKRPLGTAAQTGLVAV